ncbi:MAG: YdiU family protein [Vicinamibacterales bacterium]
MGWQLEHTYAGLPDLFHRRAAPTPVRQPAMVVFNASLAASLGLDSGTLSNGDGAAILAGNRVPEGAQPLAQAYAGHQFGYFTTLGDGRAILLGEQIAPDGRRWDIQLKGPGRTPYSRRGDGRAALGPMLREYILSEAMHALGIPTSRSLAVVATGEPVYRERPLAGAVLTRVASSHIRVGTFEWAARGDHAALAALADYTIWRHYPHLLGMASAPDPAVARAERHLALLDAIVEAQAALVARWQLAGFIHGVMNTDNMAVSGETLDYGPCAFMDRYDPDTVFSSIDQQGRYAYGNQPPIALWNLTRLAEAFLPLLDVRADAAVERATAVLRQFQTRFDDHWLRGMRAKLGLFTVEPDDASLAHDLLRWMRDARADFTNTFRRLSVNQGDPAATADPAFAAWHQRWHARLRRQPQSSEQVVRHMRASNPAVIPRNHLVEEALAAATERADLSVMHRLQRVLASPYDHDADLEAFNTLPAEGGPPYQTFCGT